MAIPAAAGAANLTLGHGYVKRAHNGKCRSGMGALLALVATS
jgi:hypothetical protein